MGKAALKQVQRRFARLPIVAMTAQRVNGIEKTTQGIVNFMGHAGSKFAKHRIFLLVGEARSKLVVFVQCKRHRIEPIEQ